ncbi:hypothetical protein CNMCM7691_003571 [Aspergillus felis]|uniref:Major facilitator superfamily (MFS) profile domain-containing protein n=1 Tax=Aspergillus felis TaxID=1287682 RepID=A0A8H6VAA3_9EURO|nr:hypothetical protein CNMCM7691_003571 [Aspergillus felis]
MFGPAHILPRWWWICAPAFDDSQRSLEFTNHEHSQTFWVALRRHWPAVTWGLFMNLDRGIVRSIVGLDVFERTYGYQHEGTYIIAVRWLSALNYATLLGAIIGALLSGLAYDRFGPRVMIAICSGLSIGFIFAQFFSHMPAQLSVGELVNGCIIAFYLICASAYVGEVTPLVLRGVVATMTNLAFSIGSHCLGDPQGHSGHGHHVVVQDPHRGAVGPRDGHAGSGGLRPRPTVLVLVAFVPDPPYWFGEQGRDDAATVSLRRLTTAPGAEVHAARKLAHIRETLRLEESFQGDRATYRECCRGPNLRPLVICVMTYNMQAFTGNVFFIIYALHFMEVVGLDASHALSMNIGLTAIGLVGTCLSWFPVSYIGRRTMYLFSCASLMILQLAIGVIDLAPRRTSTIWAQCGLMLVCNSSTI